MYQNNIHRLIAHGLILNLKMRNITPEYDLMLGTSIEDDSILEIKLWSLFSVIFTSSGVISWTKDNGPWSNDLDKLIQQLAMENL